MFVEALFKDKMSDDFVKNLAGNRRRCGEARYTHELHVQMGWRATGGRGKNDFSRCEAREVVEAKCEQISCMAERGVWNGGDVRW